MILRRALSGWSLGRQFTAALSLMTATLVFVLGGLQGDREQAQLHAQSAARHKHTLETLASTLTDAVVAEDTALMRQLLARVGGDSDELAHLSVLDERGQSLMAWRRPLPPNNPLSEPISVPIEIDHQPVGRIVGQLDLSPLRAEVSRRVWQTQVTLFLALFIVAMVTRWMVHHLAIAPIQAIDQQVQALRADAAVEPLNLVGATELANVGAAIDAYARERSERRESDEAHRAELEALNNAYRRFVPEQFLTFLNRTSILEVQRGDQTEASMTVMYCDIRSFTQMSERLGPQATFDFINECLRRLGPVVREHGGFIDKYIGDAIMALFGSPNQALEAADAMMRTLAVFNAERAAIHLAPIRIGIGVNTGPMMLGIVGEEERLEGTVVGDVVNLAARLESLTKKYGVPVLFSEATLTAALSNHADEAQTRQFEGNYRFVDNVLAKGKTVPTAIYEFFSHNDEQTKISKRALMRWRVAQLKLPKGKRTVAPQRLHKDPLWALFAGQVLSRRKQLGTDTLSRLKDLEEELRWS